jgi:ferrous iron transport protein A
MSAAIEVAAAPAASPAPAASAGLRLGSLHPGFRGRVDGIRAAGMTAGLAPGELERRLLEMGFVEGAAVELLHEGLFGRDPIAVRVDGVTIALRRKEAAAILVAALD